MFEHEGSAPGVFLSPRGCHGLIVSPTSLDRSDRASMTLRASMLVPLIYDAPNLRRVTYIVSPACGFLSLHGLSGSFEHRATSTPEDLTW